MNKSVLKHLTVTGFASHSELSTCEELEKELNEAKGRLKLAKKKVKDAKHKLDLALKEVIVRIDTKKKELTETQDSLDTDSVASSELNIDSIKYSYDEVMSALDVRKNRIKKQLEEYNSEGTESWAAFKQKLNYDLEELGTALKGFVTKSNDDHKY